MKKEFWVVYVQEKEHIFILEEEARSFFKAKEEDGFSPSPPLKSLRRAGETTNLNEFWTVYDPGEGVEHIFLSREEARPFFEEKERERLKNGSRPPKGPTVFRAGICGVDFSDLSRLPGHEKIKWGDLVSHLSHSH